MRASGGTKLGLAASVVDLTRPMMAALAGPSFHDGKGLSGAVCARAEIERNDPDKSGSAASPPSTARRFGPDEEAAIIVSCGSIEGLDREGQRLQAGAAYGPRPFV